MSHSTNPRSPNSRYTSVRRHIIGVIAVVLLLGAVGCWIWPPGSEWACQFQAACWRLGPLLAILWIAYPELCYLPHWIWSIGLVLAVILARWPKGFLLAVPFVIALAILKPRIGRRQ